MYVYRDEFAKDIHAEFCDDPGASMSQTVARAAWLRVPRTRGNDVLSGDALNFKSKRPAANF